MRSFFTSEKNFSSWPEPIGKKIKFFGGSQNIWRYREAQGDQEVQNNTFGKYSMQWIPREKFSKKKLVPWDPLGTCLSCQRFPARSKQQSTTICNFAGSTAGKAYQKAQISFSLSKSLSHTLLLFPPFVWSTYGSTVRPHDIFLGSRLLNDFGKFGTKFERPRDFGSFCGLKARSWVSPIT